MVGKKLCGYSAAAWGEEQRVLRALGDMLFSPHHVGREFLERRRVPVDTHVGRRVDARSLCEANVADRVPRYVSVVGREKLCRIRPWADPGIERVVCRECEPLKAGLGFASSGRVSTWFRPPRS